MHQSTTIVTIIFLIVSIVMIPMSMLVSTFTTIPTINTTISNIGNTTEAVRGRIQEHQLSHQMHPHHLLVLPLAPPSHRLHHPHVLHLQVHCPRLPPLPHPCCLILHLPPLLVLPLTHLLYLDHPLGLLKAVWKMTNLLLSSRKVFAVHNIPSPVLTSPGKVEHLRKMKKILCPC